MFVARRCCSFAGPQRSTGGRASREGARPAPARVIHGALRWGAVTGPAPGVATLGRPPSAGVTMRSHNQQRQARSNLLVSRARGMLHEPTPSEEALWQLLRGGALGVSFKRQVVLGERYIADFFAPSVGLVVEVDGSVHRGRRSADRGRDAKLQRFSCRARSRSLSSMRFTTGRSCRSTSRMTG
jgi:very-short-patch-repair endonuclease